MNASRIFIAFVALLFLFTIGSIRSQEAVGDRPAQSVEEKAVEDKPAKSTKEREAEIRSGKSVQEMMTPDEFKAAGLDKLSEDELQHLDAWLQGYRQTTEKKVSEQAEKKAGEEIKKATEQANVRAAQGKFEPLVSRVDGPFQGLKGRTLIKLENGTVWKQANADDRYRTTVTDHPAAVVLHSAFGYKMRIEGMPEFYVDPVHNP